MAEPAPGAVIPRAAPGPARRARRGLPAAPSLTLVRLSFGFTLLFLAAPLVVLVFASFTPGRFMRFPPGGFSGRWYGELARSSEWLGAIQVSLIVAVLSALVATVIGLMLAVGLGRWRPRWAPLWAGLGMLPLLLPPVVLGVAYVTFFYQLGIRGGVAKLAIAHAMLNTPFPFLLITAALGRIHPEVEEAAMNLGARDAAVIRTITLPLIRSDVFASFLFAFVMSLNEYIVAFLVSSFTVTSFPIQILASLRYSYSPVIAAASVLFILGTAVVVYAADRLSGGLWD